MFPYLTTKVQNVKLSMNLSTPIQGGEVGSDSGVRKSLPLFYYKILSRAGEFEFITWAILFKTRLNLCFLNVFECEMSLIGMGV